MEKITKTDEQWREELSEEQYEILRKHGTEAPFTSPYLDDKTPGVFKCAACGAELFPSDTKFDSGTGWPSFTDPMVAEAVTLVDDDSSYMIRTEVRCARCDSHLGHVFDDGPPEAGGKRYCINGRALSLEQRE